MGKNEGKRDPFSPKAIANRIKAKGLQKLRWYCQMCQKQCRDENGFKCHCMSESHQRQMRLFGENPDRIIDSYSEEFESTFLDHMKQSHRSSRVAATVVYNEYIHDRHHVHMNSTKWATLTEFVTYLGRTGKCKVDETPKGWFLVYIDRHPETLFKAKMKIKRLKADLVGEEKQAREIQRQIERAAETLMMIKYNEKVDEGEGDQQEDRSKPRIWEKSGEEKIKLSLGSTRKNAETSVRGARMIFDDEGDNERTNRKRKYEGDDKRTTGKKVRSALDEIMMEEEKAKASTNRKDYWLFPGIVVKVMSKALAETRYYKQKGVVTKLIDEYYGEIEMLENKHVLRVDQNELETVIPQIGSLVKIVNGAYRGENARLLDIDVDRFRAKVRVEKGMYDGRVVNAVEYQDICKLAHLQFLFL